MNIINMLCDKMRLIVRYCSEDRIGLAVAGMADLSGVLTKAIETIISFNRNNAKDRTSINTLTGSFRLAMDAVNRRDKELLMASLSEGIIPEFEIARHNGIEVPFCEEESERLKTEQRLKASQLLVVVCLFGYGDGSYYEELCNMAPEGSTFIVFEPEKDSVSEFQIELSNNIDYYLLDRVIIASTPGYDIVFCSEFILFLNAIKNNNVRINVNLNALKRFKENASKNVIANLHILEKCNFVDSLKTIVPCDVPVIIVSAGPSLDKNIELLKKAKGHSLIFAVDTALKYLMEHDIMPDLAITVEPIKPMANYEDDRCFDIPHVFSCESNPAIVSKERSRIFIYNCCEYVKGLLNAVGISVPSQMGSGGSVATSAFAICVSLKIKKIILIGQDLAYDGTSTHAGKVESAGFSENIGTDMVEGIDGGQVRTRSDWQGYLFWFEKMIRLINEQHLDISVIDATEGGALIHGSHVMTFAEVIEKCCKECNYVFAEKLNKLPHLLDINKYNEVRVIIRRSFDEIALVKEASRKAIRICEEMLMEDKKGSKRTASAEMGKKEEAFRQLEKCRHICESALLYSLINNYTISDILEGINRLHINGDDELSEISRQKVVFGAIAEACDYFAALRPKV